MSRTFATRRKSILEDSLDLSNIFNMYPFLQESEQVIHLYCICETNFNCSMLSLQPIKELERIIGIYHRAARKYADEVEETCSTDSFPIMFGE